MISMADDPAGLTDEHESEIVQTCFALLFLKRATTPPLVPLTPPEVTERVVGDAIRHGIEHIWMQPGAESEAAIAACREAGINVIAGGSCVLVVLGYRE